VSLILAVVMALGGVPAANWLFSQNSAGAETVGVNDFGPAPIGGGGDPLPPPPPGDDPPEAPDLPPVSMPVIVEFEGSNPWADMWLFRGRLEGCSPLGGNSVEFGGFGEGEVTATAVDGAFELILEIPPDESGDVTAVATSQDGETSNMAWVFIDPDYGS
jgi:hypothetical protein